MRVAIVVKIRLVKIQIHVQGRGLIQPVAHALQPRPNIQINSSISNIIRLAILAVQHGIKISRLMREKIVSLCDWRALFRIVPMILQNLPLEGNSAQGGIREVEIVPCFSVSAAKCGPG